MSSDRQISLNREIRCFGISPQPRPNFANFTIKAKLVKLREISISNEYYDLNSIDSSC